MNKREFKHLELLRILAVILVIFNHIDINYFYYHNTDSIITFCISLFVTILVRINIPLFLMISGSLLLRRNEDIKTILIKRVSRVFAAAILFSLIQYLVRSGNGRIPTPSVFDFFHRFINGDIQETYWFLYLYMGILLLLPFLGKIALSLTLQDFRYLIILKAGVDLLPLLLSFGGIGLSSNLLSPVSGFLDGAFYMLCGFYMDHCIRSHTRASAKSGLIALALGIAFPFLFVLIIYLNSGTIADYVVGSTTFLMALGTFWMGKQFQSEISCHPRLIRILDGIGPCVFGIYLAEQLIRVLFYQTYIFLIEHTFGIFASFLYALETFFGSLVLVLCLRRIPILRKIL